MLIGNEVISGKQCCGAGRDGGIERIEKREDGWREGKESVDAGEWKKREIAWKAE